MNILVVNDDGYQAEGIEILAKAYEKYGNIYVVAPHNHHSGASASITVRKGLVIHQHGINRWSVEGTPADCVKYALYGLKLDVDLVVSGVNNGFNIGVDTIYSGTVGAAMEALMHSKKAIAFSTEFENFTVVKKEIATVIEFIFKNELLSCDYLLNVNFPKKEFAQSKGIIITDLEIQKYELVFSENDNMMYADRNFAPNTNIDKRTDVWAMKNGYTSITPLKLGNGDSQIVKFLNEKINK